VLSLSHTHTHHTGSSPVLWVCCSALQCVAVCCSMLQCVAVRCSVLQCVAVCCNVLQCAAVCCSVLQYVTVCCSVYTGSTQCSFHKTLALFLKTIPVYTLQHTATHCNTLQHNATHCNTLQHTQKSLFKETIKKHNVFFCTHHGILGMS